MPQGPVTVFLGQDHDRLEHLLAQAMRGDGSVDEGAYEAFRRGLLQHIAMEEKVLFRVLREREGEAVPDIGRLRRDHGWIAHQLAIRPDAALVADLRAVLDRHNALEEGPAGVYARVDALGTERALAIVDRMRAWPPVKVAPYRQG
jgi:hypothetical protein